MNIIFWNTKQNENINEYLINLIIEKECDIIVLAEYCANAEELKNRLYIRGYKYKQAHTIACEKIHFFYRDNIFIELDNESSHYASFKVSRNNINFELFAVHFPSKLYTSENNRQIVARSLKELLDMYDDALAIGDFNSNPFEKAMVGASCLSALPIKNITNRKIQGIGFKNMYNPMWNFFGDFDGLPGTYYYNNGDDINYYWNMLDQVILSIKLSKRLEKETMEIIEKINDINLIVNNKIQTDISDHLPIYFSLRED